MRYMVFTCAPGFEMVSCYDTLEEAQTAMLEESPVNQHGDYFGIMPVEALALAEDVFAQQIVREEAAQLVSIDE